MNRIDRLLLFAEVARHGSFSRAATAIGQERSAVSKQVARLEEELGARLLQRTTRSVHLTEIGTLVLEKAERISRMITDTETLVSSYQGEVRGCLRIAAASGFGQAFIEPAALSFLDRHPNLEIEIAFEDRFVDMIGEGYDLAIRVTRPQDSNLIARKLADNSVAVVASPEYLIRRGWPDRIDAVGGHDCIVYAAPGLTVSAWTYIANGETKSVDVVGRYRVNDGASMVRAAVAGYGICLVARALVAKELVNKALVEVFPNLVFPPWGALYAIYPAREHITPKTREFIEHLRIEISKNSAWKVTG